MPNVGIEDTLINIQGEPVANADQIAVRPSTVGIGTAGDTTASSIFKAINDRISAVIDLTVGDEPVPNFQFDELFVRSSNVSNQVLTPSTSYTYTATKTGTITGQFSSSSTFNGENDTFPNVDHQLITVVTDSNGKVVLRHTYDGRGNVTYSHDIVEGRSYTAVITGKLATNFDVEWTVTPQVTNVSVHSQSMLYADIVVVVNAIASRLVAAANGRIDTLAGQLQAAEMLLAAVKEKTDLLNTRDDRVYIPSRFIVSDSDPDANDTLRSEYPIPDPFTDRVWVNGNDFNHGNFEYILNGEAQAKPTSDRSVTVGSITYFRLENFAPSKDDNISFRTHEIETRLNINTEQLDPALQDSIGEIDPNRANIAALQQLVAGGFFKGYPSAVPFFERLTYRHRVEDISRGWENDPDINYSYFHAGKFLDKKPTQNLVAPNPIPNEIEAPDTNGRDHTVGDVRAVPGAYTAVLPDARIATNGVMEGPAIVGSSITFDFNEGNELNSRLLAEYAYASISPYPTTTGMFNGILSNGNVNTLFLNRIVRQTQTGVIVGSTFNSRRLISRGSTTTNTITRDQKIDQLGNNMTFGYLDGESPNELFFVPLVANTEYTIHFRDEENGNILDTLTETITIGSLDSPVSRTNRSLVFDNNGVDTDGRPVFYEYVANSDTYHGSGHSLRVGTSGLPGTSRIRVEITYRKTVNQRISTGNTYHETIISDISRDTKINVAHQFGKSGSRLNYRLALKNGTDNTITFFGDFGLISFDDLVWRYPAAGGQGIALQDYGIVKGAEGLTDSDFFTEAELGTRLTNDATNPDNTKTILGIFTRPTTEHVVNDDFRLSGKLIADNISEDGTTTTPGTATPIDVDDINYDNPELEADNRVPSTQLAAETFKEIDESIPVVDDDGIVYTGSLVEDNDTNSPTEPPSVQAVAEMGKAINDNIPAENRLIPTGGTTGQALKKTSGSDYAVSWQDDEEGTGTGSTTPTTIQVVSVYKDTPSWPAENALTDLNVVVPTLGDRDMLVFAALEGSNNESPAAPNWITGAQWNSLNASTGTPTTNLGFVMTLNLRWSHQNGGVRAGDIWIGKRANDSLLIGRRQTTTNPQTLDIYVIRATAVPEAPGEEFTQDEKTKLEGLSKTTKTTLYKYDGTTEEDTVTLSQSIQTFDAIYVEIVPASGNIYIDTIEKIDNDNFSLTPQRYRVGGGDYIRFNSDTEASHTNAGGTVIDAAASDYIKAIIGIKY